MKESAVIALAYLRSHGKKFGIDTRLFDQWDVHVHVPAGAVPKDGPSAGITMLTSLASAFTQRKVRSQLAMTGEITLRGKVLPVGGIKEKILAAKRAGIKEVIMCKQNRKDVEEINQDYIKDMKFHYVTEMREVLEFALLKDKVENALDMSVKEDIKSVIAN
ncbi:Lon protease [compost metagenome]